MDCGTGFLKAETVHFKFFTLHQELEMSAGYPWLPEPRPKDLATAAASDAARAAVKPAEGRAVGHASNALSTLSATSSTDSLAESASHQMQASGGAEEGQTQQGPAHGVGQDLPAASTVSVGMSGTAPGARLGSTGAVANSPYAPPSAGRGSEWGVSTSEPSSPGAEAMHPPAFLLPHKHNSAVQPMSGAQVTTQYHLTSCLAILPHPATN